jgi:hypothetical protein
MHARTRLDRPPTGRDCSKSLKWGPVGAPGGGWSRSAAGATCVVCLTCCVPTRGLPRTKHPSTNHHGRVCQPVGLGCCLKGRHALFKVSRAVIFCHESPSFALFWYQMRPGARQVRVFALARRRLHRIGCVIAQTSPNSRRIVRGGHISARRPPFPPPRHTARPPGQISPVKNGAI